jgi:hypothetical protein
MMLHADSRLLTDLYGPYLKLIVAAADAAVAREAIGRMEGSTGVLLLVFHPETTDGGAQLGGCHGQRAAPSTGEGESAPLVAPPGGPCLLAALSAVGREQLRELAAWWDAHGPVACPRLHDLTEAGDAAHRALGLHRHLLEAALEELQAAAQHQTELSGQLYELRQLQEQGSAALEALQGHVARLQQSTCHLAHVLTPSGGTYRVEETPVRQVLPVNPEGLAGFDLYCPPEGRGGKGHLVVTLWSREADAALRTWRIPYDRLGSGWFRCALPTVMMDTAHQLELVVAGHTNWGQGPELGLASVGPWREMSATVGGWPLGQALAVMTWVGVPGTRVGTGRGLWTAALGDPAAGHVAEYQLTMEDFGRVRPTTDTTMYYLHVLNDTTGLRVNPIGTTPAAGVLSRACFPGACGVAATVQIRSDRAQFPVSFAMCLTDAAAGCECFPAAPEDDDRVVGFSGWQQVPPDDLPHALAIQLARPLTAPADLHVATRMEEGHVFWYHFADWLDVRVQMHYQCLEQPQRLVA